MRWIELGAIGGLLLACVAVWWVRRRPATQEVSTAWRDEQLRGRRE